MHVSCAALFLVLLVAPVLAQDKEIESLSATSATQRRRAAAALGRMGEKAQKAVPALVRALRDRNSLVRFQAILALGQIGSPNAVHGLAPLLRAPDLRTRQLAAQSLSKLGAPAAKVLREALADSQAATRSAAADGLRRIPKAARADDATRTALEKALADSNLDVRAAAGWALLPDERATQALIEVLKADDARSTATAVQALRAAGPRTTAVAKQLLATVRSQHEAVQWNAASALNAFPEAVVELRATLYPRLRDARFPVRAALASALRAVANKHIDELVGEALAHDGVAPHVALACKEHAAEAARRAVEALTRPDGAIAARAAHLIAALGKAGQPHIEALGRATQREEIAVRVRAARALWPLTRESTLVFPALKAGLSAPKPIRLLAIESLGSLGSAALDAAPMLEAMTKNEDRQIARASKAALRRIRK